MNRIRELRIANGWTQTQLGEKINAVKSTVSEYEREKYQLDPALICKLCDIFGCTADYLIGRSDMPYPTLPDAAARLWYAYQAGSDRDRELVDKILGLDVAPQENKKETA